jgi:surfeit locus 1 family protein
MLFRPMPLLSLATLAVLGALVALGFWQIERFGWKRDQLATFAQGGFVTAPVAQALCDTTTDPARFRVPAEPTPSTRVIRMYGFDTDGTPGWRLLAALQAPACLTAAEAVLAEVGFEPLTAPNVTSPPRPAPTAWRVQPLPPKPFLPAANNPDANTWHWYDAAALATALGLTGSEALAPVLLVADSGAPPAGLARVPPVRHLAYAVTWFGLALALLVIYALIHARAGRLRLTPPKS